MRTRPLANVIVVALSAIALASSGCSSSSDASSSATDASGGDDATTATTADAGADVDVAFDPTVAPSKGADIERSGTRLKRMLVAAGGTDAQFVGWRDSTLGDECYFNYGGSVGTACIPRDRATGPTGFADSQCTQGVVTQNAACPAKYVLDPLVGASPPRLTRLVDVPAGPYWLAQELGGQPQCNPAEQGTMRLLAARGEEIALGGLTKRSAVVRAEAGSLVVTTFEADDGSRQFGNFAVLGTFGAADEPCSAGTWKDGSVRCVPSRAIGGASVFLAPDCAGPRAMIAVDSASASIVAERTTTACKETWRAFTASPAVDAPFFWRGDGSTTCTARRPDRGPVAVLGVETASAPYPPIAITKGTAGRLEARFLEFGGMRVLTHWEDSQRGRSCRFVHAADGTYRCLPYRSATPNVPIGYEPTYAMGVYTSDGDVVTRYTDAACTAPVRALRTIVREGCSDPPIEVVGNDWGCSDGYRAFRTKAALTVPLYRKVFESWGPCIALEDGGTVNYELEELPLGEFAAGTLSIE